MPDDPPDRALAFEAATPLGFVVQCTVAWWAHVVAVKHPAMRGRMDDVLPHGRYQGGSARMASVTVYHDRVGNTLTVWFGEPDDEYVCEETGDEVVLMKDRHGTVIGFEKLNYHAAGAERLQVTIDSAAA